MKKWIGWVACLFVLTSCERDIDLKLDNQTPKVVVDAQIETGSAPIVILTNSLNYFSQITPSLLAGSFIHNANITVSDGTRTHKLKEYSIPIGNGVSFYYYTNDSSNLATAITGQNGKQYNLNILADGATYTSSTQIPLPAKYIDSLWWKLPGGAKPDTNKAVLMGRFVDPPGLGNYIRYFTKSNRGAFLPGENSVFDDQVIDGKTYSLQIDAGVDRNAPPSTEPRGQFNRGDTVTVKFCNIDKASYTFWNTWEFAFQSIGNPFSSPNKVIGNISNNALGAFTGYSVQLKTLIIPK